MNCKYFIHGALWVLFAASALSCHEEEAGNIKLLSGARFSVCVDEPEDKTKTLLTADDIETRITDITLAVYNNATGAMACEPVYATSDFSNIRCLLEMGADFTAYALANMGDMRSSFPADGSASALAAITYRIPGYTVSGTGINDRGIPMAGTLVFSDAADGPVTIPLRRLLAKLNADLSCEWPGKITSVTIFNLNAVLHPFGTSAAAAPSDLLPEQEICVVDPAGVQSGDFLFYIPENLQGSIGTLATSKDKSHDNEAVTGKDLKSYLEVAIQGNAGEGATGSVIYRSYLGADEKSDFNIERNSRYSWHIRYLPGHLQGSDWKHENSLSWKEFDYSLFTPTYLYRGERDACGVYPYSSRYENGVFQERKYDKNSDLYHVTYSISPNDNSILGDPGMKYSYFWFTGMNPGVATVTATCVDPFNPEGIILSKEVRVLDFGREAFLRTPSGDYYAGNEILVPYGTTWNNLQVGMKKTLANGSVQIVCPVVIDSDHLLNGHVTYPSSGNKIIELASWNGDSGRVLTFSNTFDNPGKPEFYLFLFYNDYNSDSESIASTIKVTITDTDAEVINLNPDAEETYWKEGSISIEATSTAVHNGVSGAQTDITASNDYTWTATGSVSGMNPQISLTGGKRVVTASKAGTVTITVKKKSDSSISASKSLAFNDKITYRLNVTPKTRDVYAGESFSTTGFSVNQDRYVNGTYAATEPFDGRMYWAVKSGSSPYLSLSGSTVTALAPGTGYLRAYTYSSTMEYGYKENEITVSIRQANHYTLTLSPSSLSVKEGEKAGALSFVVKNNGTAVDGLNASDLSWHTENSTIATVSSGGVVSGQKTGSTNVYATYSGATSNKVSVTVVPQDVTSYRYKVTTTLSPSHLRVGQSATASAVRYKKTYVNGSATTDWVADGSVTSSGFVAANGSDKVSISGNTVTAIQPGTALIGSAYSADEYENAALSAYSATLALTLSPSAIKVGGTSAATVLFSVNDGNTVNTTPVTASASLKAYTATTGNSASSIVSISGGTVTGTGRGTCYLEATYAYDGVTYTSPRVELTIQANPLQVQWSSDGAPAYVAQRGKLQVSGLDAPSATVTYSVSSGADVIRLLQNGNECYVGLLKTGSYTITASCESTGQSGTLSGTVAAPALEVNANTLYANPDGTPCHTGTDGLSGSTLTVSYKTGSSSASVTSAQVAVGNQMNQTLYDELLSPRYSATGSLLHAGADGLWATDAFASTGLLSTVTLSALNTACGVTSKTVSVYGVDPFSEWPAAPADWGSYEDYGLLDGYYSDGSSFSKSFTLKTVKATSGSYGQAVYINDTEADSDFRSLFTLSGSSFSVSLSQSSLAGLSRHLAGNVSARAYVQNRHSAARIYKSFAEFKLFVHGALGGRVAPTNPVSVSGQTQYTALRVYPDAVGNCSGTPFTKASASGTIYYCVTSAYAYRDCFDHGLGIFFVQNSTTSYQTGSVDDAVLLIVPGVKTNDYPPTYEQASNAYFSASDANALRMTVGPALQWGTIANTSLSKKVGNVLYLRNSADEPVRTVGQQTDCGYFILHLLDDLQLSGEINGNKGWINE